MKKIGNNIQFNEQNNELLVEIIPTFDQKKYNLVLVWFIGWSLCGIAIISQLFLDYSRNDKLFMVIFLALWLYFEFHVLNALRWRKTGKEMIKINEKELRYVKEIGGRGMEKIYDVALCTPLKYEAGSPEGFLSSINQSAWMIGVEVLEFTYKGNVRRLGIQLVKSDAEQLAKKINYFIKAQ